MDRRDDDPAGAGPEAQYRAHLRAGRFRIQRSRSTGEHVFYPRVAAPGRGVRDLEWVEPAGTGTVYSTTVVRRRAESGGDYNVVLVDLDEGVRLMSRIVDLAPEAVRIGMRVAARIEPDADGEPAVVFAPAETSS